MRSVVAFTIVIFLLLVGLTVGALLLRRYDRRQAAAILAREHGIKADTEGAIRELELAVELDPRCEARALERAAELRRWNRDYRGAVLAASRVLELEPDNTTALMTRGLARGELRDLGAGDDFARIVALQPKRWQAYCLLGNVKAAKGDSKGAIADYTRAIDLHLQQDAMPYLRRAREHRRLGQSVDALADLMTASGLDPRDPDVLVELARYWADQQSWKIALEHVVRALDLQPDHAEALELKRELLDRQKSRR